MIKLILEMKLLYILISSIIAASVRLGTVRDNVLPWLTSYHISNFNPNGPKFGPDFSRANPKTKFDKTVPVVLKSALGSFSDKIAAAAAQANATSSQKNTKQPEKTQPLGIPNNSVPLAENTLCPKMVWKSRNRNRATIIYKGRGVDQRASYVLRQAVTNDSKRHPDLRKESYIGFFIFSRFRCGEEFMEGLANGSVALSIYDREASYEVKNSKMP